MRRLPFPVVCDRLLLVLPADHPLTRWKGRIPLEAFDGERFVLRQRATGAGFYKQRSRPLCCRRFKSHIVWRELDLGAEAVSSILLVTNTRQENADQFIEIIKGNI